MSSRALGLIAAFLSASLLVACPSTTKKLNLPPVQTVPKVELDRYLGTWYEIASFPQSFQRGCHATTATYSMAEGGEIAVVNRCNKDALDGPLKTASGRARVVDTATNARLQVSFFGPFWGDYWIVDLDEDYQAAVVGHPGRDYLWVLSRSPTMDEAVYQGILARLEAQQYPTDRLVRTVQR
jgi:apolipoprotein D and lipocalin family protein